ncbi:hypothetical protein GCM10010106_30200 [Thermopolyspora flexuosa]|uniref:Tetratricopeptide repeat protein n=1 Tax=Thermopolyspora flexuosa TaxID=103836 RepID=A0A543ISC9_9ACTN|nr:hypothetical protein [Thermopolyspora flexuosa]TQM73481.1 hypothetical protein FHX40_0122 [Thermopolyspora flexuosa]GGM81535.1 hypothetical protein GCM10010106_30200 [Thermopolyspora flexuosa]
MAGPERRETLLKVLLAKRHLVTHRAFCREYDKVARKLDRNLITRAPGREQYARWLAGKIKTKPSADRCRVLEHMFPGYTVAELLAPYDPGKGNRDISPITSELEEAATDRRQVFQIGAMTVTAGLLDNVIHGPDQFEQALHSTTVSEAKLAFLESEAEQLGLRGGIVPPETLIQQSMLHLSSVRALLENHQPSAIQQRLARVGARLAFIVGEHLFTLHQPELARRWWRTAIYAAEEAGDRHFADHAYAACAYLPTYFGDPQAVLAHVTPRLEQATKATPAIAWMWGLAAMAHATLGDRNAFERANTMARNTLARCSPDSLTPSVFSFLPRKQAFYEARGYAELGDVEGAKEAACRALADFDSPTAINAALTRLAYATALAKAGEVEEACRLATMAVTSRPVPAFAVMVRARELDALVPRKAAAAQEWRETLAGVPAPR